MSGEAEPAVRARRPVLLRFGPFDLTVLETDARCETIGHRGYAYDRMLSTFRLPDGRTARTYVWGGWFAEKHPKAAEDEWDVAPAWSLAEPPGPVREHA